MVEGEAPGDGVDRRNVRFAGGDPADRLPVRAGLDVFAEEPSGLGQRCDRRHERAVARPRPAAVARHPAAPEGRQAFAAVAVVAHAADQHGPVVARFAALDPVVEGAEHLDAAAQAVDHVEAAGLSEQQVGDGPEVLEPVGPGERRRGFDACVAQPVADRRPEGIDLVADLRPVVHRQAGDVVAHGRRPTGDRPWALRPMGSSSCGRRTFRRWRSGRSRRASARTACRRARAVGRSACRRRSS